MKKIPLILAALLGVLDVALAAGIVLLLLDPGSASASGNRSSAAVSESFEDNSETYEEQASQSAAYSGMIQAEAEQGSSAEYEPTPSLTRTPSPSSGESETVPGMPDSDFVFPYSSVRLITDAEMNAKLTDKETSQRAINEIYARHGYLFHADKNAENYAYFNSKSWYRSLTKIDSQEEVRKLFNDTEVANVDALIAYQKARGWS